MTGNGAFIILMKMSLGGKMIFRKFLFTILVLVNGLLFTAPTYAWDETAHEIICHIAYSQLDADTKKWIDDLTSQKANVSSFSETCFWADGRRKMDHFVNVPRSTKVITAADCIKGEGCIFDAIRREITALQNKRTDLKEKQEALKYLSHWIGDIHQPVRIGFADDFGGNLVRINKNRNCGETLHEVWAKCIVDYAVQKRNMADNLTHYANTILNEATTEQRMRWLEVRSLAEWANESYQLGVREDVGYCVWLDGECRYTAEMPRMDMAAQYRKQGVQLGRRSDAEEAKRILRAKARDLARSGLSGTTGLAASIIPRRSRSVSLSIKKLIITDEYEEYFTKAVEVRMVQAGLRLALVLNSLATSNEDS